MVVLGAPIVALAAWLDSKTPDLAVLKKGEWMCVASHEQLVGRVFIPECDDYRRAR